MVGCRHEGFSAAGWAGVPGKHRSRPPRRIHFCGFNLSYIVPHPCSWVWTLSLSLRGPRTGWGSAPAAARPLPRPACAPLGCLRTRHSAVLGCLRPLARRSGPRPLRRRAFLRSSARGRARRRPAPRPCRPSSAWWLAMGECAVPSLGGGGAGRRLRGAARRGGADRRAGSWRGISAAPPPQLGRVRPGLDGVGSS